MDKDYPQKGNIPGISQGLVKMSIGLRIFDMKGSVVTNDARDRAELTASMRVVTSGRVDGRKAKGELLSYSHLFHSLISWLTCGHHESSRLSPPMSHLYWSYGFPCFVR